MPPDGGGTKRINNVGGIQKLTRADVTRFLKTLGRTVVRSTRAVDQVEGAPENIGDPVSRGGHVLLTYPDPEDERAFEENFNRKRFQWVTPHPDDRPLAEFIYMVPIEEVHPSAR